MDNEYNLLLNTLAEIRDSFSGDDFIDDEGYDRFPACVGSPLEVAEMIKIKLNRLNEQVKELEEENLRLETELMMSR